MNTLVINAADDKILFSLITKIESYTTAYINSRENFDKFMKLLLNFLNKKKINISKIERIFINLGPGKFTSLRIALSVAKAISLANKAILIGFKSKDLINKNYKNLIKFEGNKSLIKPIYSS